MEADEITLTDAGVAVTPKPAASPVKAIKASELANRWGCTKAYLSKIKGTHGFDPSKFATVDDADDWLRKTLPHLYDKYKGAPPKPPKAATIPSATTTPTPPASPPTPAAGTTATPSAAAVATPALAIVRPKVEATEEDFFDIHIARARVASEVAFERYMREVIAGSPSSITREAQKLWNDASAAYSKLKTLNMRIQKEAAILVPLDAVKHVLADVISTWQTLLDRLETRVHCSPETKEKIRKAVLEIRNELNTSMPKVMEGCTGNLSPAEDSDDGDDK